MVYPGQPHFADYEVPILDRPIDDPGRKMRVVCVGGGIAGITTSIRFRQHLGSNISFQIYEKNDGAYVNRKNEKERSLTLHRRRRRMA